MADNVTPGSTAKSAKKTILIVDDDVKMRTLLREILSADAYELFEAEDGLQALEIIHKHPVDLVITDRTMPKVDGIALLRKLKEEHRDIPSLMISGYGDEDLWASAIGFGAEDYILKPFSTESVMKVVKRKLHD